MPKTDLHICLIIGSMRMGGAERAILNLANGFAERKLRVDLLLIEKTGSLLTELDRSIRIIDLGKKKAMFSSPAMARYFRKENPAVLIASQNHVQIAAMIANKISGKKIPFIWNEHSIFSMHVPLTKSWRHFLMRMLVKYFMPEADAVTTVSKGVAEDLIKHIRVNAKKVFAVYNAVFTDNLTKSAMEKTEHPFFSGNDIPVIIGVGRLTAQKDFSTLIKAFVLLREKIKAKLILIGSGDEMERLKKLSSDLNASGDISFTGAVKNPFAYLSKASVFVQSSTYEGLSMVIIEALACGCPVVSTDCPNGPAEILENGKYGALVPVGNAGAMAAAIEETLLHPPDRNRLIERANCFHVNKAVNTYLELFKKIVPEN